MALIHVNSATPGASSPYATWATAAATFGSAALVSAAGDDVYVHPSHVDAGTGNVTWNGTQASPVKIVCGTPGATSGITAEQSTGAAVATAAGSVINWNGSFNARGVQFKITGATGSGGLTFGNTAGAVMNFTNCNFENAGTSGTSGMNFGSATSSVDEGQFTFNNCTIRFGNTAQIFRVCNRAVFNGVSYLSGSSTPSTAFIAGIAAQDNGAIIEGGGIDFSNLGTTFNIVSGVARTGAARFRNCKMPSGWAGNLYSTSLAATGFKAELLNYGDGDTNYKFWIEDRHGRAKDETTIKRTTNPASDGTTSYSMRVTTLTNCAYPSTIYRSPPIIKRHAASPSTPRLVAVQIAHDGSSALTDKEVWVEVEYLGVSGFPLASFTSDVANYLSSAAAQPASGIAWDGATGTGPNGTTTWHRLQLETPAITIQEEGYLIATVCVARPDYTLFIDPQLNVTVA